MFCYLCRFFDVFSTICNIIRFIKRSKHMEKQLFYKKEASCFEEALPIGNGRLGAMVYGGVKHEKISLNEDTLYSGTCRDRKAPENAPRLWEDIRRLTLSGKDLEARNAAVAFTSDDSEVYLPLCTLNIETNHSDFSDYSRHLALGEGIADTQYVCRGKKFLREYFVSRDYECTAVHFSADCPGEINLCLSFEQKLKITSEAFSEDMVIFEGVCPSAALDRYENPHYSFENSDKSVHFTNIFRTEASGGKKYIRGKKLYIENADEATIYIYAETSFGGVGKPCSDHRSLCLLRAKQPIEYAEVKKAHIKDFSSLYNRTEFCLSEEENPLPTDERIINFNGSDPGLYELLFNFGRYLLISSSRPGTRAANLQGIWNEEKIPIWNCAYTVNINTEMNYWPAHVANLSECFEPFINLLETLSHTGRVTARDFYGAPGFVCHHNTDLWGHANPVGKGNSDSFAWSFWNMGSGWMACQLFDEYEYTLDKEILRERIYPIMKEAAIFYLTIAAKDENGKYIISPATSPENRFKLSNGENSSISKTTAMTASIIYELFSKLIRSTYILDCDYEFRERLEKILPDLYTPKIGGDGRLMEWYEERIEAEPRHRHVSHLFGLYPGETIRKEKTPELWEACRKSLSERGDVGTGWSLAWKVCLWARLSDGNHALKILNRQLCYVDPKKPVDYVNGGGIYPNMTDAHPPFQIDGNFGVCAGIAEMLVQSEIGKITLLPALPDKFENGRIIGLKARGNVTVSVYWENGALKKAVFSTPCEQKIKVCYADKCIEAEIGTTETVIKF